MLLVVNIGNTNIRFGVFQETECIKSWTLHTTVSSSRLDVQNFVDRMYTVHGIDMMKIDQIIIGSVVPTLTLLLFDLLKLKHHLKPILVNRNTPSQVSHCSNQMGTDLYANAVAAHYLYPKKSKIVIDFGTALTFSCLDEAGMIHGVSIAPGVVSSLSSLIQNTAQLSEIGFQKPAKILGLDTESCMQSGMIYGYLSMIEGMIERINQEVGAQCMVISTGGLGHIYAPLTDKIDIDDKMHTLKGLRILGIGQQ